ncbi:MAG: hypothetical protein IBX47_10420, partial [Desulfuromonadales bacterium]|nr:hypothetical protein [Desulfuromonadales bacterium]
MIEYMNIQKESGRISTLLLALLLMLLYLAPLAGCAGKISRTEELLAKEYLSLSNNDLLLHYYQLEDQIVADERSETGSSVSLGLGTGVFGSRSHYGGGVGISTGVGSQPVATKLRDRR